jgi:hypothetical protein
MSRSTPGAQRADRDPDDAPRYSGRILLRMPPELHGELAERAERDGMSLNQLLTRLLAEGVGSSPRTESRDAAPSSLRTVLFVNLVLVGILAVAAIVLVVIAIRAT